jgi:alpha-glucosidase
MNYWGFQRPVMDWLAGQELWSHHTGIIVDGERTTTASLVRTLTAFRAAIAWCVARSQYNLLDSHDTARVWTELDGDEGRIRAAYGFLLTYVGVPSILYGGEVGLEGEDGTDTRRPMPWDSSCWDEGIHDFLRRLIRIRTGSDALCRGGFQVLEVGPDHLAYLRDTADDWVIVLVVRGPGPRPAGPLAVRHGAIPDGVRFDEALGGGSVTSAGGALELPATPAGVALWQAIRGDAA